MEITETLESFGKDGKNHKEVEAIFYTHDIHEETLVEIEGNTFTIEEVSRILEIMKFVDKINKD
ncbi:hypothetical protein VP14_144 [Vibrio phage VPMCC14]|nr:hypothetical protein VP14_144 [Vibrio phage VPMCC14]